ncbi:hypothetical protein C8R44DRAFT_864377 [Mycena epipterygia]|nr:hypothetical protein C8R44DRAFT_864377 [Mycena epipterygia]
MLILTRLSCCRSSSSGSIVEVLAAKRGSPLREGVAFYVPDSEATSAQTHTLQLPGRTASDSSGASSSGSSRKSKSGKSKSRKEATPVDEGDQEKILIVLLDEKDRDSKSETKDIPDDDATWHGLERRLSTRSAHKPSPPASAHHSPWMGPLVHLNEDITYIHTPEHSDHGSSSDSDSDSDSDDGAPTGTSTGMGARWSRRDGAVPIKNLLSAMGYLTPEAAVIGGTPSPYGSYAALPAPYNSPYVPGYVSPYPAAPQQGSPYHSPYPQPPSRPQTPVSYFAGGTPPMQTQQVPWASPGPGPGYPPTSYNSPAPGGYASPYASPAAAGYASSAPAGYASPAAAGYASPAAAGYANSAAAGYANSAAAGYANSAAAGYASPAAAGYANSAAAGYASPAAGYASPPAAYYSPAAGYPNLAAGYSSPYVQPLQGAGADRGSFYYS